MRLFSLILLPAAGVIGTSYLTQANQPQPQPKQETIKAWKIQPVAIPVIDKKAAHQVLIARQKQLADKNFSCDCNGCRIAAQQVGVTLN